MKKELMQIEGAYSYVENFVKIQIGGRTLTIDCTDGFSRLDDTLLTSKATTEQMVQLVNLLLSTND